MAQEGSRHVHGKIPGERRSGDWRLQGWDSPTSALVATVSTGGMVDRAAVRRRVTRDVPVTATGGSRGQGPQVPFRAAEFQGAGRTCGLEAA